MSLMVKLLAMMCKLVVMELLYPLEVTEPSSQSIKNTSRLEF